MMCLAWAMMLGVSCCPDTMPSRSVMSFFSPPLVPSNLISDMRGWRCSSMTSQTLSPATLSTLISTLEYRPWRQNRLTASVISAPGMSTLSPMARPEKPMAMYSSLSGIPLTLIPAISYCLGIGE